MDETLCVYIYTIKLHVYCLHASVAGKQCHILLHGSVAVMQSIYTIYFVCQRCWQANYIGLYVSVADKQCHICLYASVAGNQTIWACMSALLTSNAISACVPALLASKLYGLVCQRCWQARYCGLYVSVAGKQAICASMHTYHQNIIQTSVVVLSSICTHIYICLYLYTNECILVNFVAFYL